MSEADIEVAMKPFGQTQSILSRSHEGTGLGLPLVDQFLKLHNAELTINSATGLGTGVQILMPIHTRSKLSNIAL